MARDEHGRLLGLRQEVPGLGARREAAVVEDLANQEPDAVALGSGGSVEALASMVD